jgi:hypothetical protein
MSREARREQERWFAGAAAEAAYPRQQGCYVQTAEDVSSNRFLRNGQDHEPTPSEVGVGFAVGKYTRSGRFIGTHPPKPHSYRSEHSIIMTLTPGKADGLHRQQNALVLE